MEYPGRNDPCTCGSGLKFKKCCINKPYQGPVQQKEIRKKNVGSNVVLSYLLALGGSNE